MFDQNRLNLPLRQSANLADPGKTVSKDPPALETAGPVVHERPLGSIRGHQLP